MLYGKKDHFACAVPTDPEHRPTDFARGEASIAIRTSILGSWPAPVVILVRYEMCRSLRKKRE